MWKTLRAALRVSHISTAAATTTGPLFDYQMALFSIVNVQGREPNWPCFHLTKTDMHKSAVRLLACQGTERLRAGLLFLAKLLDGILVAILGVGMVHKLSLTDDSMTL